MSVPETSQPDAKPSNLAERLSPASWLPFLQLARLDRPIGWWLLLLPCWWSSALACVAAHQPPNLAHLLLFWIGAIAMRGAGSTYNDMIDRDIDAKVERTRMRPLPAGRASIVAAKIFLVAQALVGLCVLVSFNGFAIGLGFLSLLPVAIYPFMKRVTSWPQAVLGLAFAWGGLMGWAAVFGHLDPPALLIYGAAIFWTMGYDTLYALQDVRDDSIVGVHSTARLFGTHVRAAIAGLYAIAWALALWAVLLVHPGILSFIGLVAFGGHLAWQVWKLDQTAPAHVVVLFRANRDAGLLLFAGLSLDSIAKYNGF